MISSHLLTQINFVLLICTSLLLSILMYVMETKKPKEHSSRRKLFAKISIIFLVPLSILVFTILNYKSSFGPGLIFWSIPFLLGFIIWSSNYLIKYKIQFGKIICFLDIFIIFLVFYQEITKSHIS